MGEISEKFAVQETKKKKNVRKRFIALQLLCKQQAAKLELFPRIGLAFVPKTSAVEKALDSLT